MRTSLWLLSLLIASPAAAEPTLVGYARLPADTFREGPTSGQFIEAVNGKTPPFVNRQPVQGISSLVPVPNEPGSYYALSDNGYGSKANSADYVLCVYKVTPDFEAGGGGEVAWELAFELSDPNDVIEWPTVADGETYPDSDIPVPAVIRDKRLLTGADFDVESMVLLPDGTVWLGDEFGPFLLHFDAEGRLLEPPVQSRVLAEQEADPAKWRLPAFVTLSSPDHPRPAQSTLSIERSAGFEGLALFGLGDTQIPLAFLEKPLEGEEGFKALALFGTETDRQDDEAMFMEWIAVRSSAATFALGEATAINQNQQSFDFLLIERDGEEGPAAIHKKLLLASAKPHYLPQGLTRDEARGMTYIDLQPDWITPVVVADLLDLADPDDLDGDGEDRFRFPYFTIESVAVVDERTVIVCNDNNYPFSDGRPEKEGPDATEFILIRFDRPLAELGGR